MPELDSSARLFGDGDVRYVLIISKLMITCAVLYLIMNSQRRVSSVDSTGDTTVSRRSVLAASGIVAFGGLSGCLSRVASAVTNTTSSPAAAFTGERTDEFRLTTPKVNRLTPTLSGGSSGLPGEIELEGWVTSSAVMAQDYHAARSNQPSRLSDEDSDGDGISDVDEDDELLAYLGGNPIVAERFTICLPDAEVPGGNGSIAEAVTPKRLIDYITGQSDGGGRVYSWGTPKAGPGDPDTSTDCDDDDPGVSPGAVCGTTPHFVADVSGPTATGGGMEVIREDGEIVLVRSSNESSRMQIEILMTLTADPIISGPDDGGSDGPESSTEAIYHAWSGPSNGGETESSIDSGFVVAQVMVQPPGCPSPFPGLLFVARGRSDGQLVYTGGWVIDDAALYEGSETVLTMAGAAPIVGIDLGDLDGDGLVDAVERLGDGTSATRRRRRRGARLDTGTVEELTESGVLSAGVKKGYDKYQANSSMEPRSAGEAVLTHLALDAPVFHLVNAGEASNEVKFKAGAELSGQVN